VNLFSIFDKFKPAIKKNIKVVTVRKPHYCSHCHLLIAKGEKATVYSGIGMIAWEQGEHGDVLGHYNVYGCRSVDLSKLSGLGRDKKLPMRPRYS
jgi:hypothetical protein